MERIFGYSRDQFAHGRDINCRQKTFNEKFNSCSAKPKRLVIVRPMADMRRGSNPRTPSWKRHQMNQTIVWPTRWGSVGGQFHPGALLPAISLAQDVVFVFDSALLWHGPSLRRPGRQVKRNSGQVAARQWFARPEGVGLLISEGKGLCPQIRGPMHADVERKNSPSFICVHLRHLRAIPIWLQLCRSGSSVVRNPSKR